MNLELRSSMTVSIQNTLFHSLNRISEPPRAKILSRTQLPRYRQISGAKGEKSPLFRVQNYLLVSDNILIHCCVAINCLVFLKWDICLLMTIPGFSWLSKIQKSTSLHLDLFTKLYSLLFVKGLPYK